MAIEVDLGCEVVSMKQFIELTDTPNSYTGQAGKYPKVNGTEDGLEFGDAVDGVQTVTGDGVGGTATDVVMNFPDGTEVELIDGGGVSVTQSITDLQNGLTPNHSDLNLDDGTNPHGTTKSDVGLSNVDNTSDLAKPISTATQTALDGKAEPRTVVTKTADFTPSNEGNTLFIVDSATDVTVTINTGAGTDLQPMYFYQKGLGQILISIGTATVVAPPSQSFKSEAQYAEFALDEISTDVWKVTGETE